MNAPMFIVFKQDTADSPRVIVSEHDTKLKCKRAHNKMEREFGKTGIYPKMYGWSEESEAERKARKEIMFQRFQIDYYY